MLRFLAVLPCSSSVVRAAQRPVCDGTSLEVNSRLSDYDDVKGRINQIQNEIERTDSDYDREKLQERLAKLAAGVALLRATGDVEKAADALEGDERTGALIVRKALEEPLKQIAVNAGYEGGVVIEKVRGLKANEGFNAATGEYGDMYKFGVPDPAKVTRSALQNAASIAALFLTTEAVVAEKPEKTPPAPGTPPGGGMGDMDF